MGVTSIQCEPLGVKQQLQELLHFDLHPPSQVEASSLNGFFGFLVQLCFRFLGPTSSRFSSLQIHGFVLSIRTKIHFKKGGKTTFLTNTMESYFTQSEQSGLAHGLWLFFLYFFQPNPCVEWGLTCPKST